MAHTLYVHIFLYILEFVYGITIKLAFGIPDSCNENDFVTGNLDTYPYRWPQSKLLNILSIQRLELR